MDTDMKNSNVHLLELPNELFVMILKHLNNTEMLHSLMGVNVRLDEIISDRIFTNSLTLMRLSMDNLFGPLAPRKLDRFCSEILPRIAEQVKWIHVDAFSMKRVLLAGKYSNLLVLAFTILRKRNFSESFLVRNSSSDSFNHF